MKDVVVKVFATETEARLAKAMLDAHGIKSFTSLRGALIYAGVQDNSLGAELSVLEKDAEKAKEILDIGQDEA